MPLRCAVSLDNLGGAWKAMLVERVTGLSESRMREVCEALRMSVAC